MSIDLLAAANAVPPVPFINWQYIYCWLVSLFGRVCATDPATLPDVDVPSVGDVVSVATTTAESSGGFWSWLWPFGHGGSADAIAATSTAADVGFWAGVAAIIPGPIKAIFIGIGTVLGWLWGAFSFLSFTLSALLFVALLVVIGGLILIRLKEWGELGMLPPKKLGTSYGRSRWQDMLDAAMSTEPKRWREGILAADWMLGELLTRLGYHAEATSEQLRTVPEGAFVTLPQAWEAHRIRNFIASRNSNFILTQREAFRVMKLYEQVFEEFDFI